MEVTHKLIGDLNASKEVHMSHEGTKTQIVVGGSSNPEAGGNSMKDVEHAANMSKAT